MAFREVWQWLHRRHGDTIPGVVYSEKIRPEDLSEDRQEEWAGVFCNVNLATAPPLLHHSMNIINEARPGPEKEPYTFWERAGLVPVHPSRIRPRQFYHPITDFSLYNYDEISPEEKELTAKWMAKVMEFNGAIPAGILCAAGCIVLPLHTVYRMPLLVAAGITGVAVELTRSYMGASEQRQDLDDFILTKELWYIKNVETYQLGVPRIPIGDERTAKDHATYG
eukprot:gene11115-7741_t